MHQLRYAPHTLLACDTLYSILIVFYKADLDLVVSSIEFEERFATFSLAMADVVQQVAVHA